MHVITRITRGKQKPIFLVYGSEKIPASVETLAFWHAVAASALAGRLHIVGLSARPERTPVAAGINAKIEMLPILTRPSVSIRTPTKRHAVNLKSGGGYQQSVHIRPASKAGTDRHGGHCVVSLYRPFLGQYRSIRTKWCGSYRRYSRLI